MGNELEGINQPRGRKMDLQATGHPTRTAKSFGMKKVIEPEVGISPPPKNKRGKINENLYNKKKEKITIVAKNKSANEELRVMDLIQDKNSQKVDYDLIYSSIGKHFFMQTLNDQARNEIIVNMSLYKVKANEKLFTQGSVGHYWFIVHEGELDFFVDDIFQKKIEKGDSFGEVALMNNVPRNGTAKTVTDCELWALKSEIFHKILDYLSSLNHDQNMKFLESTDLPLDHNMRSLMASNLIQNIFHAGDVICKEGDPGSCMYIIKDGEVDCVKNGRVVRTLVKGDNFGQKALLEGNRRTLDVVAKTDCTLYSISVDFFRSQFGDNYKDQLHFSFMSIAFNKSKNFSAINAKILQNTFHLFKFKNFKKDEVIYEKGTNALDKLCVILEGNIIDKNMNKIEGKRYEILFENELVTGKPFILKHNLVPDPDCTIAEADFNEIQKALGGSIKAAKNQSSQISTLEKISLFKFLSDDKKAILTKEMKIEKFNNGKKILSQGGTNNKLYIIKEGRVDFFLNSKYLKSLTEGEDFGSKSLIFPNAKNTTAAITNGSVVCYTISAEVFKSILDPNLKEHYQQKFYLEDYSIELKDLDNVKELGRGNYGFVNLVRCKKNKQLYAIKALSLKQIKIEKLEKSVELEKDVLLKLDHPFIMKMVKYLKNENFIFFLTEFIHGKELWEVMREIGMLTLDQVRFYGGSVLLTMDYIHKKQIIYRDIKPENIMINDKSYPKIIDFGTVKEIKDRTTTIVGTPEYMAPEMVKGTGYSFQVDIWATAVLMYELFCGKVPFGEDKEDPLDVYQAVAKEDLTFPSFVHDENFMGLINKMLKKNPTSRLWKYDQIKEEPFFKNFNWDDLLSLSMTPPYTLKMDEITEQKPIPYLTVLKNQENGKSNGVKKMASSRQIKFDKWVKNF